MQFALSVMTVFGYAVSVLCLGCLAWMFLLKWMRTSSGEIPVAASLATSFLLGCGLFCFYWLALGLAGWFSPTVVLASLLTAVLVGGLPAYGLVLGFLRQAVKALAELPKSGFLWGLLLLICLALLVSLAAASFAGPVVVGSDASSFYMVLPKMMAATGHLQPLTDSVTKHSTFGFMGEMHYAAGMALGAGTTAKGITFFAASALLLLLFSLGSGVGLDRRGQLVLLAVMLSSSAFTNYVCDGKVDTFSAAFGLAALYWAMQIQKAPEKLAVGVMGVMLAWSVYAKLSMLIVIAPMVVLIVMWRNWQHAPQAAPVREYLRSQLRIMLFLACCGLLMLAPLMIKNWVFFHEPFAPIYYFSASWGEWFKVRTYTGNEIRRFLFAYPFALTYGKYFSQGGTISPLLLAFLPTIFWLPKPKSWAASPLVQISLASVISIIIWVLLFPKGIGPRYILPALIVLAPLAAKAAVYFLDTESRPRLCSVVIWLLLLIIPVIYVQEGFVGYHRGPLHAWRKLRHPGYMGHTRGLEDHPVISAMKYLNKNVPPGKRLLLGMSYRYWLRPDILASLPDESEYKLIVDQDMPSQRWQQLEQRGFQYIIIDSLTHKHLYKMLCLNDLGEYCLANDNRTIKRFSVQRVYHHDRWSIYKLEIDNS